jgi:4'-phosphopantetheinyl transferase
MEGEVLRMSIESGAAPIRLWCAFYREIDDPRLLGRYRALLSEAERSQELRFYFADDRQRYLVTRALVRTVLSAHVFGGIRPEEWQFASNRFGRPEIGNEHPELGQISFNISHTEGLILLGIACAGVLGVDVEALDDRAASLEVAAHSFAPSEHSALCALPVEQQRDRFFEYWTLKESYIKARGLGLSIPLQEFGFRFPEDRFIELWVDPWQGDSPDRWHFWQFRVRDEFLAAVCAERSPHGPTPLVASEIVPLVGEKRLAVRPFRASSRVGSDDTFGRGK